MSSSKGSKFTRTLQYFRDADPIEARAALAEAQKIVDERNPQAQKPATRRRTRRAKAANGSEPVATQPAAD